jgi:hypothetical protein
MSLEPGASVQRRERCIGDVSCTIVPSPHRANGAIFADVLCFAQSYQHPHRDGSCLEKSPPAHHTVHMATKTCFSRALNQVQVYSGASAALVTCPAPQCPLHIANGAVFADVSASHNLITMHTATGLAQALSHVHGSFLQRGPASVHNATRGTCFRHTLCQVSPRELCCFLSLCTCSWQLVPR